MRSCPFCHSPDLELASECCEDVVQVECSDCGALGPKGRDDADAERLWNLRTVKLRVRHDRELEMEVVRG